MAGGEGPVWRKAAVPGIGGGGEGRDFVKIQGASNLERFCRCLFVCLSYFPTYITNGELRPKRTNGLDLAKVPQLLRGTVRTWSPKPMFFTL